MRPIRPEKDHIRGFSLQLVRLGLQKLSRNYPEHQQTVDVQMFVHCFDCSLVGLCVTWILTNLGTLCMYDVNAEMLISLSFFTFKKKNVCNLI